MTKTQENLFDETMIEDWLDADSHSGKLPSKFNFDDLQLIGELLNPEIKKLLDNQQALRGLKSKLEGE